MININNKTLENFTFIDLFAGIGGFRLALQSFGAKCVFSSEIDEYAKQTYQENFNEEPLGDITKIAENDIPNHDILCAGFPCQPFSISGKQKGFEDTRGTLFFDIARIVKAKQPKILLLENVKNLKNHDKGRTLKVIISTLNELNYDVYYDVLNSCHFNVPQNRERLYFVCFRKDLNIKNFNFLKSISLTKVVKDVLLNENDISNKEEIEGLIVNRSDIVLNQKRIQDIELQQVNNGNNTIIHNKPIRIGYIGKGGQGERIYHINGIAVTLLANGGGVFSKTGGYLVNGKCRKLHPRECARLMGFPDDFKLHHSSTQALKQLGNSIVVDVLQHILLEVVKGLRKSNA